MDNQNFYKEKLTPAAKDALKEEVEEFETMLMKKAFSIAERENNSDKEISLRDILEARDLLINIKKHSLRENNRRRRLGTLITTTGALYSTVGVFIYMYQNSSIILENNLGLVVALTGIITVFSGLIYNQYLSRKLELLNTDKEISIANINDDFDIVKKWGIIEKLGSNLMLKNGFNINESRSVNDILKFLSKELHDEKLYGDLMDILNIRNKIIHDGFNLNKTKRIDYLNKANKIIKLLESLEK